MAMAEALVILGVCLVAAGLVGWPLWRWLDRALAATESDWRGQRHVAAPEMPEALRASASRPGVNIRSVDPVTNEFMERLGRP
jgi:hypothetical protein